MKKGLNILLAIVCLFFLGKKLMKYPENSSLKQIVETYYSRDFEKARDELNSFLVDYPNSADGWIFYGTVNLELLDSLNAEVGFRKGYELNSESDKALVGLGIIERMKGNYELARKHYEDAIDINPRNPDSYSSLLVLELKNGNYSKAVELGEQAKVRNLSDNRPGILGNLAIAYHYNGQLSERDEVLKELESLDYVDLKYLQLAIDGKLDILDFL